MIFGLDDYARDVWGIDPGERPIRERTTELELTNEQILAIYLKIGLSSLTFRNFLTTTRFLQNPSVRTIVNGKELCPLLLDCSQRYGTLCTPQYTDCMLYRQLSQGKLIIDVEGRMLHDTSR